MLALRMPPLLTAGWFVSGGAEADRWGGGLLTNGSPSGLTAWRHWHPAVSHWLVLCSGHLPDESLRVQGRCRPFIRVESLSDWTTTRRGLTRTTNWFRCPISNTGGTGWFRAVPTR